MRMHCSWTVWMHLISVAVRAGEWGGCLGGVEMGAGWGWGGADWGGGSSC